ncbi:probable Protein HOL1 [Saccharomycodes ludwigii]|uniref:Probable Protein HOL1 n=1 Tax=Saccharomycodes ludwigii TaxID=36035 RepID=A0A376BBA7_9ASCO|nr:probable Protein HOL1 [Saccharomycodes ludwigii]
MQSINDKTNPEYIPGTVDIFIQTSIEDGCLNSKLKTDPKSGIILMPQPSDSPNDPLNWSPFRKYFHFALMSFITAFTAATSNDAGAAQDSLNEIYGISYDAMNTGAGVLFLGIGWGTFFMGPFAYLYGRKLTYIICTVLGLFGALWFGLANRTADTIWSQLFVGISESCAEAQVQLSLTDLYFQHQLGSVLTIYILATSIGTFLGPLIAGYISDLTNFRWVGYTALIINGGLLIFILFGCEETYFDRSRYRTPITSQTTVEGYSDGISSDNWKKEYTNATNSKTENKFTNKEINLERIDDIDEKEFKQQSPSQAEELLIDGSQEELAPYWKRIALITKATNLKGIGIKQYIKYLLITLKMFSFPPVWLAGFFWGWQDVLLSFYLTTEEDQYYDAPWNYSDAAVAIMNVPTLIGAVIGCLYAGVISDYFVLWLARRNKGIVEAEYRLVFAVACAIICPAGLFMFGVGTAKVENWRVMYVGLGFIGFGWGCSGDIAMSYLMDCYPEMVLEGMVCTALINNNLAMIFTFTCSLWLDASGIQNTYIALAVINFGITCMAFPMYIYGKRIRKWTKSRYLEYIEMRDSN